MNWKPVILRVDGTPSVLEGQKILLEENGYRVLSARNGEDSMQASLSNSVDLVFLDGCMPEMNGGMAAVRLKNAQPDVPVALLSSDECLPAVDLQAVDCLMPKSEPITNFLGKIDYLLSLRFLFQPFVVSKLRTRRARNHT